LPDRVPAPSGCVGYQTAMTHGFALRHTAHARKWTRWLEGYWASQLPFFYTTGANPIKGAIRLGCSGL